MQWTNMHFCDFSLVDFFALGVNLFYLRLRDNTQRLYVAKHLPLQSGTYRDTGFFNGQSSIT